MGIEEFLQTESEIWAFYEIRLIDDFNSLMRCLMNVIGGPKGKESISECITSRILKM